MPKPFYKHKLLLDDHLYHRRAYPTLNEYFDVKHIKDDLHHDGMVDSLIYKLAVSTGRIIAPYKARPQLLSGTNPLPQCGRRKEALNRETGTVVSKAIPPLPFSTLAFLPPVSLNSIK